MNLTTTPTAVNDLLRAKESIRFGWTEYNSRTAVHKTSRHASDCLQNLVWSLMAFEQNVADHGDARGWDTTVLGWKDITKRALIGAVQAAHADLDLTTYLMDTYALVSAL
jgi:hypothetical protein